ncbi:MAG: tyrosine--tRNA ligase, partial [Actinomycetia bacterium]|nr:tyrosine--tRNA ligase [Actinomycetes bacterium]
PLLTKADGTKFGKTESGTVWLDPAMTSPYAFHQFFVNAEDSMVGAYLRIFSERGHEEIEELDRLTATAPHLRAAQHALADDITDLVHSVAEREAAVRAAEALFGRGDLRALDAATLESVVSELAPGDVASVDGQGPLVVDALVASRVVDSKGAARRAIAEGGAYLNNAKVMSADARLGPDDLLAGRWVLLRRGKKTVGAVQFLS